MNEMGAAWILDKPIIPILLHGIEPKTMKGFIDGNHVSITKSSELDRIPLTLFKEGIITEYPKDTSIIFQDFIKESSELSIEQDQIPIISPSHEGEDSQFDGGTSLEDIIQSSNFKKVNALMLRYIADNYIMSLGDRWMAEGQVNDISMWENDNGMEPYLSTKYHLALRFLVHHGIVVPSGYTSYGNVREYKITDEYQKEIYELTDTVKQRLNKLTCDTPLSPI